MRVKKKSFRFVYTKRLNIIIMRLNSAKIKNILRMIKDGESYDLIALKYDKEVKDIKRIERKYILLDA